MGLSIAALFVYIFGAYAYGHLLWLSRHHRQLIGASAPRTAERRRLHRTSLRLFTVCAIWFVLHVAIEFKTLLGAPRNTDMLDLATLEVVLLFPALIFHTYLLESLAQNDRSAERTRWMWVLWGLYAVGIAFAIYFPAAIFGWAPRPPLLGRWIGTTVGALFTVMSILALVVRRTQPRAAETIDQQRLGTALNVLFGAMIVLFVAQIAFDNVPAVADVLMFIGRSTPLAFLLVSVYFESRVEFYDLVIKRGVLLVLSLVLTGAVLAVSLGALASIPEGATRPWIFAVLLLPVAMVMPWLHDRVGRLLDQWWFGREFTPVEAVKHVLGAMQEASDEASLTARTEATLSEMFRRHVVVLRGTQPVPANAAVVVDINTLRTDEAVRLAVLSEAGSRVMLSEDVALLRSLGGVFGYMLENVRLQRKRQEQEQLAQQLRLQSSRSELKALRAQINPHFLFNALNAIASLIHTDPARADAAVEQLAEVFRYTLRRSEQEWAPLDQELAFARAYLDVEQARFGKRLEYTMHADDSVSRALVPSMLLQTLVENAVKHGISRLRTPGRIEIHASRSNQRIVLEVRDTGPGPSATLRPATASAGESFGLRSVRDRLQGHFATDASLELRRENDITMARIDMPLIEDLSLAGAVR